MFFNNRFSMAIATGGYVGRFPFAPGTVGSLIGLPIAYLLVYLHWSVAILVTLILTAIAIWAADRAEHQLGTKDPGCIVVDEIAGMVVALLLMPFTLKSAIAGFLLFRIFDIIKPPPARQLERRLKGGWGIVLDDIVAGMMANIVLRAGLYLWA